MKEKNIEDFYKNIDAIKLFVASMETNGFLGNPPYKNEELKEVEIHLKELSSIDFFVKNINEKYNLKDEIKKVSIPIVEELINSKTEWFYRESYEKFEKQIDSLIKFVTFMRTNGFFGEEPQKEEELNENIENIKTLMNIKKFVYRVYINYGLLCKKHP